MKTGYGKQILRVSRSKRREVRVDFVCYARIRVRIPGQNFGFVPGGFDVSDDDVRRVGWCENEVSDDS